MRLQRLNMDTTWLVWLGDTCLLIDPWLEGVEVDYAGWFNTQWHKTPPISYDEIAEFDAVLITQKYPDHCHLMTLKHLQPPLILAPVSLRGLLKKHLPEASVKYFDANVDQHQVGAVSVRRLRSRRRIGAVYDAYLLRDDQDSLLIANHGLSMDDGHALTFDEVKLDVLLSPFNTYQLPWFFGGMVSPGLSSLKSLIADTLPRHVVATHDEQKYAHGLIPALARVDVFDPQSAAQYPWLYERCLSIPDYRPVSL